MLHTFGVQVQNQDGLLGLTGPLIDIIVAKPSSPPIRIPHNPYGIFLQGVVTMLIWDFPTMRGPNRGP